MSKTVKVNREKNVSKIHVHTPSGHVILVNSGKSKKQAVKKAEKLAKDVKTKGADKNGLFKELTDFLDSPAFDKSFAKRMKREGVSTK